MCKGHPSKARQVDENAAVHFLGYASLGSDYETIQAVSIQGISNWLDAQMAMPPQINFKTVTEDIWEHFSNHRRRS